MGFIMKEWGKRKVTYAHAHAHEPTKKTQQKQPVPKKQRFCFWSSILFLCPAPVRPTAPPDGDGGICLLLCCLSLEPPTSGASREWELVYPSFYIP
jgi:hypothetical protein